MDYINVKEDNDMKKIKLDKDALLGGIVLENEKYQVVHMNLKTGIKLIHIAMIELFYY